MKYRRATKGKPSQTVNMHTVNTNRKPFAARGRGNSVKESTFLMTERTQIPHQRKTLDWINGRHGRELMTERECSSGLGSDGTKDCICSWRCSTTQIGLGMAEGVFGTAHSSPWSEGAPSHPEACLFCHLGPRFPRMAAAHVTYLLMANEVYALFILWGGVTTIREDVLLRTPHA